MATKLENERLAVLETKMDIVVSDVSEMKVDIKSLLAVRAGQAGIISGLKNAAPWVAIVLSVLAVAIGGGS